jgi:hypothetical protein
MSCATVRGGPLTSPNDGIGREWRFHPSATAPRNAREASASRKPPLSMQSGTLVERAAMSLSREAEPKEFAKSKAPGYRSGRNPRRPGRTQDTDTYGSVLRDHRYHAVSEQGVRLGTCLTSVTLPTLARCPPQEWAPGSKRTPGRSRRASFCCHPGPFRAPITHEKPHRSGAFVDAGGGTRTPDTRIMMMARRGRLGQGKAPFTRAEALSVWPEVASSTYSWTHGLDPDRRVPKSLDRTSEAREVELVFEPLEEAGYHVYATDLPGLHTQGEDIDDASRTPRRRSPAMWRAFVRMADRSTPV